MLHDDQWIPVEQHPSFWEYRVSGSRVIKLWGLPFPEIVTPEHRYWAKWLNGRRNKAKPAEWVEGDDLSVMHYIGTPNQLDYRASATGGDVEAAHRAAQCQRPSSWRLRLWHRAGVSARYG
jgi:hypothetical protein